MRKLLLSTTALIALAAPAGAVEILSVDPLQTLVSQSKSSPCIICGTVVQNPPTFGFNNFDTTGHTGTLTLYSTNLFGTLGDNVQASFADNYTVGEIANFFGPNFTFGVAIDVNAAGPQQGDMVLESFQLINLGAPGIGDESIIAQTTGPIAIADIQNGNGFADYLISGFSLNSFDPGDRIAFRAVLSNMSDGPDSFYLVAQPAVAVPGPIVGAGIPGIIAGALTLLGLARQRRKQSA